MLPDCPRVIKVAVMVVKRMSKYFCQYEFFSSHAIKTALFWCLRKTVAEASVGLSLHRHVTATILMEMYCCAERRTFYDVCCALQQKTVFHLTSCQIIVINQFGLVKNIFSSSFTCVCINMNRHTRISSV